MGSPFFFAQTPRFRLKPAAPLREALNSMLLKPISKKLVPDGAYNFQEDIPETSYHVIQDHCSEHVAVSWGTGIGVMDAADLIVAEAVSNGNIADKAEEGIKLVHARLKPKKRKDGRSA